MMKWNPLYTQDSIGPFSLHSNNLCDWVMVMMFLILMAVTWFYFSLMFIKANTNTILEHKSIEFAWTSAPMIILSLMASISMKTLYTEELPNQPPVMNLMITGHQWYWEYYYPDFNINFDSFLAQWENSNYRNLECDTRTLLPVKTPLRIAVTSADVIHSWSVPSLMIKLDATPGRIISFMHYSNLPGMSFGFCAELCGVNHSYMPIALEHTSVLLFKNWLSAMDNN
uniref:Cytochrome c oxidase subunit 2 n=1 Tax=Trichuris suis TaxID=68888 RepID=H9L7D3_9BILA|nr:cytochrome c oxidase subunit II [Trichuris suis]ACY09654.1 cytochrome c oxidase subunit II [Trichuris suis]ALF03908.1 cytochrome c oxidase subunit II [Trichuris suis]